MPPESTNALDRRPLGALAVPAVVATVLAAALAGIVSAYAVGDPGAVVRWSVVLSRVVRDVAATATIGLLLLGGFLVPETTRTARRARIGALASGAAVTWLIALLVNVLADFADIAGLAPTNPRFWNQFFGLAWELPTTRMPIISALVVGALLATTLARPGKVGLAWCWLLGLLALLPLALAGHSVTSRDHMSSINALAVHLIAATCWAGGLLALVTLRRDLSPHLRLVTTRYSIVAGWSYAALGGSGLLAVWFNLSSVGELASVYGAMVAVKATVLVLAGGAGWWHRRHTIRQVDDGSTGAFTRLALGELALLGVALGTAVALARTPPPSAETIAPDPTSVYRLTGYPDPGPPPGDAWVSVWHADWLWIAVAAIAVGVYLRWVWRLARRGDRWPILRTVLWVFGWAVFVYAMCGAPGVYGRILFSWHMIMHMTIAMIVPLLLVPAAPITLALRALPPRSDKTLGPREIVLGLVHSRVLQVLANPVVAAVLFFFSLATFYFTPLFNLALSTHTGHVLMTLHFLLSGYLYTWVLIGTDPGPRKWPPLMLLVVLFATVSFHAFLGVVITGTSTLLAPEFFGQLALGWQPDPLADQHRAGAIAWGTGEAPTLALAIMVTWQWVRTDARETARRDRQAERDDDAELTAYNADLARRAQLSRAQQSRARHTRAHESKGRER